MNFYALILIALLSIRCSPNTSNEKKNSLSLSEDINVQNDSTRAFLFDTISSLPDISLITPTRDELEVYDGLANMNNIEYKQASKSQLFKYITRTFLDEFLNFSDTKGASFYMDNTDGAIHFHDFYYRKDAAKQNFSNMIALIKKTRKTQYLNEYHDFFKRGMIIILNEKYSKISILEFNIFIDPNDVHPIIDFFEARKNRFDGLVIILGSTNHTTFYAND